MYINSLMGYRNFSSCQQVKVWFWYRTSSDMNYGLKNVSAHVMTLRPIM